MFSKTVLFISQREHYIFLEGEDYFHSLLHKEGAWNPLVIISKV